MSRRLILLALALLVLPAQAALAEAPAAEANAALAPAPAAAPDVAAEPQAEDAQAETDEACLTSGGGNLLPGLQPDWTRPSAAACSCKDQCRRDRDCNKVCGSFGGECVMVNSCCRECWCFG